MQIFWSSGLTFECSRVLSMPRHEAVCSPAPEEPERLRAAPSHGVLLKAALLPPWAPLLCQLSVFLHLRDPERCDLKPFPGLQAV